MKSQSQDSQPLNFGLAIFDYDDESLIAQTIYSIRQIDYNKKHLKIVLSTKHHKNTRWFFDIVNDHVKSGWNFELIISLDERVNVEKEAYSKCGGAHFICKLMAGQLVKPDAFKKINDFLTKDKSAGVAFEADSMKIINFNIANNFYLEYGSFDLLFETVKEESKKLDKFHLVF